MAGHVKPIPEGFHTVTPYLSVTGIPKLIDFLKEAFDATEVERMLRPDSTVHPAELRIGDSMLMGESPEPSQARPANLYLYVPGVDSSYARAVQAGAVSLSEPANIFYGDRGAGVKDPSGNTWRIATHIEDDAPEWTAAVRRGGC